MKKLVLLLLALILSLGMLASCEDNDGDDGSSDGGTSDSGTGDGGSSESGSGDLSFGDEGYVDPNGWTKPHNK